MALSSIQLATISPSNRAEGQFTVDVHSDDGLKRATFDCGSEGGAIKLRNALREHADRLRATSDFSRTPRGIQEQETTIAALMLALHAIRQRAACSQHGMGPEIITMVNDAINKATHQ